MSVPLPRTNLVVGDSFPEIMEKPRNRSAIFSAIGSSLEWGLLGQRVQLILDNLELAERGLASDLNEERPHTLLAISGDPLPLHRHPDPFGRFSPTHRCARWKFGSCS